MGPSVPKLWELSTRQKTVFICLHTTFLLAFVSAIVFGTAADAWAPAQTDYQKTLIAWGIVNVLMQALFFAGLLWLHGIERYCINANNLERAELFMVMETYLWAAGNVVAYVFCSVFFARSSSLGTIGIYHYSLVLFSYLTSLVALLFLIIYVYVWPTCR